MANTLALDDKPDFPLTSQPAAFDEPIFDKYYDVEDTQDVPNLPPKSALRASRMLDSHGLKLGGVAEAAELVEATTPHDVYLSSEEDASSEADDFSDYEYDSSVEDPASPTRRTSHEDTARVVSVVFAGKPSIVDLPATRKRPASSSSLSTARTRSSTESSAKPPTTTTDAAQDRPVTPASINSSQQSPPRAESKDATAPQRKSLLLSEILIKKKPPFLSIDPYANGSTYSLDIPRALDSLEGEANSTAAAAASKTPRTPTALLKGVTRSFSLARRRSRPNLSGTSSPARDNVPAVPRLDTSCLSPATPVVGEQQQQSQGEPQQQQQQQQQTPLKTPMTPITYTDILKAVKRNATVLGAASPPSDILSPTSPGGAAATVTAKRGILSGLAARRRSVKLTGRA
jgi:hypothetical protein